MTSQRKGSGAVSAPSPYDLPTTMKASLHIAIALMIASDLVRAPFGIAPECAHDTTA